jgi:hypothetical protein
MYTELAFRSIVFFWQGIGNREQKMGLSEAAGRSE